MSLVEPRARVGRLTRLAAAANKNESGDKPLEHGGIYIDRKGAY